jgi:hypothetical protein
LNEDECFDIAPGLSKNPLSFIYDKHAKEVFFTSIFLGKARTLKTTVKVTPFIRAISEIRRKDKRGVTPQNVFYMAMKILRLRINKALYATFRCVGETEHTTKKPRIRNI